VGGGGGRGEADLDGATRTRVTGRHRGNLCDVVYMDGGAPCSTLATGVLAPGRNRLACLRSSPMRPEQQPAHQNRSRHRVSNTPSSASGKAVGLSSIGRKTGKRWPGRRVMTANTSQVAVGGSRASEVSDSKASIVSALRDEARCLWVLRSGRLRSRPSVNTMDAPYPVPALLSASGLVVGRAEHNR